ncbi:hypothetical protein AB6A40_001123 [Gnathostoma spinigerum]|uniref:Uncharacterized protein n=1 Tax=Gnathostoma spinigerum TaxID=75299 RepID=A0ABD6E3G3_9BILA
MAQHGLKKKVTLPKGTKQKIKKVKTKGPKRGHNLFIAPKKMSAIQQNKIDAEVTRVINEKNEELLKNRADHDVGRIANKGESSK